MKRGFLRCENKCIKHSPHSINIRINWMKSSWLKNKQKQGAKGKSLRRYPRLSNRNLEVISKVEGGEKVRYGVKKSQSYGHYAATQILFLLLSQMKMKQWKLRSSCEYVEVVTERSWLQNIKSLQLGYLGLWPLLHSIPFSLFMCERWSMASTRFSKSLLP